MLGIPCLMENSGGSGDAGGGGGGGGGGGASAGNHESDVVVVGSITSGFGEEERGRSEEGDRNFAGNRWPRQETLALLKIRSDMDLVFRDSSLKGPLWEEVSRKLAELGYHRSAKKCKEKFENVYKYYRRTKDTRAAKQDGKAYRFFDQLEVLDNHHSLIPSLSPEKLQTPTATATTTTTTMAPINPITTDIITTLASTSSSSGEESERTRRKKKKLSNFFEKLMKEVIEKQDVLQKKFLEAIEKREQDRMAREEAWKMQELARMNREHELLVQERSISAAKDAAVIAFLQKLSEQSNPVQLQENPQLPLKVMDNNPVAENAENFITRSPSRWPKAEVEALIRLRTALDLKYQETGPKGPLWEEISAAMKKLGYNRSSKRCKEKWENINKYFKKVKESNKRRPEDSKTCPYFNQLDALYKEKTKKIDNHSYVLKPEELVMQMISRPEQQQQQPLLRRQEQQRPQPVMEDLGSENMEQNHEEDGDVEDDEDEDEDNEGTRYEIVTNNTSSLAMVE